MEGIILGYIFGYIVPHVLYDDGIHPVDAGESYVKVDSNGYAAASEIAIQKKYPTVTHKHLTTYLPKEIVERWNPKCRVKLGNGIKEPL